ncbi:MAG: hypothetical protein ACRYGK_08560 [Janthinobacterium lividum]
MAEIPPPAPQGGAGADYPLALGSVLRARNAMRPGEPFQHLPAEVENLVLRTFSAGTLHTLAGISRRAKARVDEYKMDGASRPQSLQIEAIERRRHERSMAFCSKTLADTWFHPDRAPAAALQAEARAATAALTHVRVALAQENLKHWDALLAAASSGGWQVLELDVRGNTGTDSGHALQELRAAMPSITGLGQPGRQLHLRVSYDCFGKDACFGLTALLREQPHIGALRTAIRSFESAAVAELGDALAASSVRHVECVFHGRGQSDNSGIFRALSGNLQGFIVCGVYFRQRNDDAMIQALKSQTGLIHFQPGYLGVEAASMVHVIQALQAHAGLRALDLSGCEVNDAGAVVLARLLRQSSQLETLCLDQAGWSDLGLTALAQAVGENSSLLRLELRLSEDTAWQAAGTAA